MIEPKCENCKHYRECKVLIDKRWVYFHICDVLLVDDDGKALVVTDNDRCEMFTPKGKQNNE